LRGHHGAHITHWQPLGHQPVLHTSGAAIFAPGKPIRGGVPICHPWFGPATLGPRAGDTFAPAHGIVRTLPWNCENTKQHPNGGVTITLALVSDDITRPQWPFDFTLRLQATFGRTLVMELETTNTGPSAMPLEEALHTYLAVGDVRQIKIEGLDGAEYLDKTDKLARKPQSGAISFAAETDRAYLNTTTTCRLDDPVLRRTITVAKAGSNSTVVWNPEAGRAAHLTDIGQGEWPLFACIETANISENRLNLAPGETHRMTAEIAALGW